MDDFNYVNLTRLTRCHSTPSRTAHENMVAAALNSIGLNQAHLNRYSNIVPFDSHLASCSLGYVNASLIKFDEVNQYIIAAGPMAPEYYGPDTRPAFWHCAVENDVKVMVGLAEFGKGFSGCADYLQKKKYGDWDLSVLKTEIKPSYTRRNLKFANGQTEHFLVHFHFTTWPNYSIPEAVGNLRELIYDVNEVWNQEGCGKLMVHCSGGCGRSGTFVATLQAYRTSPPPNKEELPSLIFRIILQLRQQRHPWMVEGEYQYRLIQPLVMSLLAL